MTAQAVDLSAGEVVPGPLVAGGRLGRSARPAVPVAQGA
jgi:hypothetical protein